MSGRRKHVTQNLQRSIETLNDNQHVVRALGIRGDNLVEVEFPNRATLLVLLPARFNKKLWIRKGSYLIVEQAIEQLDGKDKARISGTIEAVLYDHDLAALQKQGCWPKEFETNQGHGKDQPQQLDQNLTREEVEDHDSDDDLPPLQPNTNRPVIVYDSLDDDDSEEEQYQARTQHV